MRHKAVAVILTALFLSVATASPKPERDVAPAYAMTTKVKPEDRLSSKWAFVVDTSSSIIDFNLFDGILSGFTEATAYPSDQLQFCMYAFNDRNCWAYRKWAYMPLQKGKDGKVTEEWSKLVYWLYNHTGTMSFGAGAINRALHRKVQELTVIIISDGGFTEGGPNVFKTIKDAQKWRVAEGYGKAIITTIGIENMACKPLYPKPTNKTCQSWMRSIGVTGNGGYFYVHKNNLLKGKSKKESSKEN